MKQEEATPTAFAKAMARQARPPLNLRGGKLSDPPYEVEEAGVIYPVREYAPCI